MQSSQLTQGGQERWQKIAFWVIPAITVLVWWIIIGTNLDNIRELIVGESAVISDDKNWLSIGKEVKVTWLLEQSSDFRVYTHTILTDNLGTMWLRSSSLNLSLHQGWVVVRWIVREYYDGKYILEVVAVEKSDVQGGSLVVSGNSFTGVLDDGFVYEPIHDAQHYFAEAALLFDVEGDWDYHAELEWDVIKLRSLVWEEEININYFSCQAGDVNYDCDALAKRFTNAAEYKLTSWNGDLYYKLPEADARFVRNGSLFGYFINGADKQTIEWLTQAIVLPNRQYVEETVMPHAIKLCTSVDASLVVVDKFTVSGVGKELQVTIDGTDAENQKVQCILSVDLTNDLGASLVSLTVNGTTVDLTREKEVIADEEDTIDEIEEQESDDDINREDEVLADKEYDDTQVAINVDNPYIFESSRWHRMVFPSRNITFAPGDWTSTIDLDWVNCYTYTNLSTFGSDDTLQTDPSVQIFECSVPGSVSDFGDYRYESSEDGKSFLIKAVDPAWQEFVDNLVIE